MIYSAPCIMFWMRTYPLLGQVGGGWALEFESFLGPVKSGIEPTGKCHLGPKKLDHLVQRVCLEENEMLLTPGPLQHDRDEDWACSIYSAKHWTPKSRAKLG
jgi:hypothetical protein